MSSLNKIMLIGNLGKDPETVSGMELCKFSIATTEKWFDKKANEKKEETTWHNVDVWGKQAEHCMKYLRKGRSVYVEGMYQCRKSEKDGKTQYFYSVKAHSVQFLGGKEEGASQGQGQSQSQSQGFQRPAQASGQTAFVPPAPEDDSIPF